MQIRVRIERVRNAIALASTLALFAAAAGATPSALPGYAQLPSLTTPDAASGGLTVVGGSVFVGQDVFGVQSVVRVDPGGAVTTLATGFAGLSGLVYDPANDRLVVGANDVGPGGAGNTLFGIPDPFGTPVTPPDAAGLALAPNGSVPFAANVTLDPTDPSGQTLFVSDASGPPGSLLRIDVSNPLAPVVTSLQAVSGFAGGVVVDPLADAIYFGSAFGTGGSLVLEVPLSDPTAAALAVSGDLGGQFDLALDADGLLYSTSFSDVLRIDPDSGDVVGVATGFSFATAIDEADGVIYALDFGVTEIYRFAVVPEPAALPCLLLGLALLARRPRRRER